MDDEITLERDIDRVFGLTRADGGEGASLLDEVPPISALGSEPEDDDLEDDEDD